MSYSFNYDTLATILASTDDMYKEIASEAIEHFKKYTQTVTNFEANVAEYKQEDLDTYRTKTVQLDRARRNEHNVCIGSVDILNRIAQKMDPPIPPFCELPGEAKDADRTEIARAIFEWAYVHIKEIGDEAIETLELDKHLEKGKDITEQLSKEEKKEKDPKELIMEQYNALSRTNPYPMVQKDGKYRFVHYLKQTDVPPATVNTHMMNELIKQNKVNKGSEILSKALRQVEKSKKTSHHSVEPSPSHGVDLTP